MPAQYVPTLVPDLTNDVQKVMSNGGGTMTCALKNGAVSCWGSNGNGGLGDGSEITIVTPFDVIGSIESEAPVPVTGLQANVEDIFVSSFNACAKVSSEIKCWGYNAQYQLANGTNTDAYYPKTATALPTMPSTIAMSIVAPCAIFSSAAYCWGANAAGGLGSGGLLTVVETNPVPVLGLNTGVQKVVNGVATTCAIRNGGLYCWGSGYSGLLGTGNVSDSFTPIVPNLIW